MASDSEWRVHIWRGSATPVADCIRASLGVRRNVAESLRAVSADAAYDINQFPGISRRPAIHWDYEQLSPFDDDELDKPDLLLSAASEIYRMRRARDRLMPAGLVGEPAWDMLLALYSEGPDGLTVASICRGSGVSQGAALRWLGVLEAQGLTIQNAHHRDERIALVALTKHGRAIVERCLKAMLRSTRD